MRYHVWHSEFHFRFRIRLPSYRWCVIPITPATLYKNHLQFLLYIYHILTYIAFRRHLYRIYCCMLTYIYVDSTGYKFISVNPKQFMPFKFIFTLVHFPLLFQFHHHNLKLFHPHLHRWIVFLIHCVRMLCLAVVLVLLID